MVNKIIAGPPFEMVCKKCGYKFLTNETRFLNRFHPSRKVFCPKCKGKAKEVDFPIYQK